ncbi:MAG: PorT family protein [Saprospiraceae bacterium]|nr:PorT family protein [Saprospiraceae bacterium]
MKQDMSPQEKAWQKAIKQHIFLPQEQDWQAMEKLLDQQGGLGGIAPIEVTPPPGPVTGGQSSLIAGLIIGLVLMFIYGLTPGDQSDTASPPSIPKPLLDESQLASVTREAGVDEPVSAGLVRQMPEATAHTNQSGMTAINPATPKNLEPTLVPFQSSLSSTSMMGIDAEIVSSDVIPKVEKSPYRMEVEDIRMLTESEYTPGLMAFSRLIRPIAKVPIPMVTLAGMEQIQLPKAPSPFLYGLVVGIQTAIPEGLEMQSPLPHVGLFARYNLKGKWHMQAELISKWARLEQIYASEEALDNLMLDPATTVGATRSSGLWYVEMPIMVGYTLGRHSFQGGIRTALVYEIPTTKTNQKNFPLIMSVEQISTPPQKVDVGITAGWSWMMSSRLALDVRTNYGFSNLINRQSSMPGTFRNTDLMASVRWYW